jgi:putative hemolysin
VVQQVVADDPVELLVRVMGGDPSVQREEITKEELRDLVASRPGFHQVQRQILSGAIEAEDRILREICVPRSQVAFLPADANTSDAITTLVNNGFDEDSEGAVAG